MPIPAFDAYFYRGPQKWESFEISTAPAFHSIISLSKNLLPLRQEFRVCQYK
jgi:hypothetical protein